MANRVFRKIEKKLKARQASAPQGAVFGSRSGPKYRLPGSQNRRK